jgi:hypothetical protein
LIEPRITKAVDGANAYFTVYWSRLRKAEKFDIISKVPSVSGIFELYYQDKQKKLNLLYVAKAFYGGLMNELRRRTDPELEDNVRRRQILSDCDCYYRYAPSDSYKDMTDVLYFFSSTYFPDKALHDHSGRFSEIYVKEVSEDKLVDV